MIVRISRILASNSGLSISIFIELAEITRELIIRQKLYMNRRYKVLIQSIFIILNLYSFIFALRIISDISRYNTK